MTINSNDGFMKVFVIHLFLLLFSNLTFSQSSVSTSSKLIVKVTDLRNNDGLVGLRIYNSEKGFPTEKADAFIELFTKPKNGVAVFTVPDLALSSYAIGTIHDENENKEFDKNFIGFPKEGFGASNNPKVVFSPPSFFESEIKLDKDKHSITIRMKYF